MRLAAKHSSGAGRALKPPVVRIQLARGKAVPLRDAAGRTVYAHVGRVWITEENGAADVVLQPGESFLLARPGLAVVEAFGDASISIR
jgi:hypothetical protein